MISLLIIARHIKIIANYVKAFNQLS